jgi:hypothetical protein
MPRSEAGFGCSPCFDRGLFLFGSSVQVQKTAFVTIWFHSYKHQLALMAESGALAYDVTEVSLICSYSFNLAQ